MSGREESLPLGYEFVRVLGAGGFGEVVLAKQLSLGRHVAVKRIHGFMLADEESLERFRREGRLLAAMNHPAVVRVFDFVTSEDATHLVMEFVPGEPLSSLLEPGALPVAEALVILRDIADALAAASSRGVVHRDIKPPNVMVLPSGHAKLGDFGLARVASDPSVFRTAGGPAMGTPAYFPPELSQGGSDPDERSDAYSFAVMAYEMLTGVRPYNADDLIALITAHWRLMPPDPTSLVPGFPPEAAASLLRGLDKDPSRRPLPSVLVDELSAIPAGRWPEPTRTQRSVGADDRAAPTVRGYDAPDRPPPSALPTKPDRRRRRGGFVLAAVLAVAVAAGTIWLASRGTDTPVADVPFHVAGVRVTSDPASGRLECPRRRFALSAAITTNGAGGILRFRWTRPDGEPAQTTRLDVPAGQQTVEVSLVVEVQGRRAFSGDAVIDVLQPDPLSARTSLSYTCR